MQEREYIHVRCFECHSQINLLFKIMIYYLVFSVILSASLNILYMMNAFN